MLVQYNRDDISDAFKEKTGSKNAALYYQNIKASSQIRVSFLNNEIKGEVEKESELFNVVCYPENVNGKIFFENHHCSCQTRYCRHMAAVVFCVLDVYPHLERKATLSPNDRLLGSRGKKTPMPTASRPPRQFPTHIMKAATDQPGEASEIKPENTSADAKPTDKKKGQWLITKFFSDVYDAVVKVFE